VGSRAASERRAGASPVGREEATTPSNGPSTGRGRDRERARRRGWLVRRVLLVADLAALVTAFCATQLLFGWKRADAGVVDPTMELLAFLATLPVWVVVAKMYGLYDRDVERNDHSTADDIGGLFHVVTVGAWVVFGIAQLTSVIELDFRKLALFWALAITLLAVARMLARAAAKRSSAYVQNALILGAGEVGQLLAQKIRRHPEYKINVVGFVDREPKPRAEGLDAVNVLGPPEDVEEIVRRHRIERVIVAFSGDRHEETLDVVRALSGLDVQTDLIPRLFEVVGTEAEIYTIEGIPAIGLPPFRLSRSSRVLKRTGDVALASLALLLLAPVFLITALLIKLDSRGPVFFRQHRIGEHEADFAMLKFRTMHIDAEQRKRDVAHLSRHAAPGGDDRMFKIEHDPRVTRVGSLLRRYSIDELPQLFNVLKGDMSLVGPRPLIPEEHRYVNEWAKRRLDLKPGMTGLWQVLGRSAIPFSEMVKLDYIYASTWSMWKDLRLLGRTIPIVVRGNSNW
jgi:exopolysaccharide biosynthesis polyprenyl glycosylphosphotransferase